MVLAKAPPQHLCEALSAAAAKDGALIFHGSNGDIATQLSFAELNDAARGMARKLLGSGLVPGDAVGLIADTRPDFIIAFFACQFAGLVAVPLPSSVYLGGVDLYAAKLAAMLRACDAKTLIVPPNYLAAFADQPLGETAIYSYDQVADFAEAATLPAPSPTTPAYIQFSSGSTAEPKGIVITQEAICLNAHEILVHGLELNDDDRAFSWLPFYHDMGLVGFVIAPILGGCTTHYLAPAHFARRPFLWLELMSRHQCSISYAPSFAYRLAMMRATSLDGLDLTRWRVAGVGGDFVRQDVLQAFAAHFADAGFSSNAFLPSYGLAEATLAVSFAKTGAPMQTRQRPGGDEVMTACGYPLPSVELQIVDADGDKVADGVEGHVVVRGPSVATTRLGSDAQRIALRGADAFLDTGDTGFIADRQLYLSGRAKDLMIYNGRNIWPQDVESAVERQFGYEPGRVAAFDLDRDGETSLLVLIEARRAEDREDLELNRTIRSHISAQCGAPTEICFVRPHFIPKTSSGKIARRQAKENYLAQFDNEPAPSPNQEA